MTCTEAFEKKRDSRDAGSARDAGEAPFFALFAVLLIIFPMFSSTFAHSGETQIAEPTKLDVQKFAAIYNNRSTPLFIVDLLKRSCSVSGGGSGSKGEGRVENVFYPERNRLHRLSWDTYTATTDSENKHIFSENIADCPLNKTPDRKMESVVVRGGKVVGWFFASLNEYCLIPVFSFPSEGGCRFEHCAFTVPAATKTTFISPYQDIAEKIRITRKPIQDFDHLEIVDKRSCLQKD